MWFHRSFESRSWSRKPRLCWCPQKVVWRPAAIVWRNWFITGGLSIGHYGCIFELNRCTTCKWTASQFWSAWKSMARIAVLKEWLVWMWCRWLNRLLPIKVESHGWTHPLPHHGQWLQTRCSTWKLRILFGDKVSSLWRCFCGFFCCWITWCTSPWKMKSWNLKFWLLGRCFSSWHPGFSPKKISLPLLYFILILHRKLGNYKWWSILNA